MTDSRNVEIWDLPTRLFHWLLVASVVLCWASAEGGGWLFAVHAVSGSVAAGLVVFRILWGFMGSRHSRFSDFVRGRKETLAFARRLAVLRPGRHVGHNPLGGWMALVLLALVALTSLTGMFSGDDGMAGPFLTLVAPAGGGGLGGVHETVANLLIVLAFVHVGGVALEWLLTRENLVGAMIHGRKTLDETEAAAEPPVASSWRAAVAAFPALVLVVWLVAATDFTGAPGPDHEPGDKAAHAREGTDD